MKKFSVFAAIFLLAACVAPTTMRPNVSQEELAQEAAAQQEMIEQNQRGRAVHYTKSTDEMRGQIERVWGRVQEAGADMCTELGGQPQSCMYDLGVEQSDALNAYADGTKIVVSTAMLNFVNSDEELALVLSHEMAHNMLNHVRAGQTNAMAGGIFGTLADALLQSQGVNTGGALSKVGSNMGIIRYSKQFESEADYVGLYIMTRAGYQTKDAPHFWRRFSVEDPRGMYGGQTHPSNPERFVALNKTIAEIEAKKKAKMPLIPEFRRS